jgi:MFS family permease
MWAVFMISMLQMPALAIMPSLNLMQTVAFPNHSLSEIQTVLALSSLVMPCVSLLSAAAVRRGLVTKKTLVVTGLFILGFVGILSLFLHTSLWNLAVLSAVTGVATGCYITTTISIMMDQFDSGTRQKVLGLQAIFLNIGAILAGLFGGLLAAWRWYGGYMFLLVGIPLGVLALFSLAKETRTRAVVTGAVRQKLKIKPQVFYYTAIVTVFLLAISVCGGNLAPHMAESGVKNTAIVGTLTSVQMAGGAVFGIIFRRFSRKFKDYTLFFAFFSLFCGLTMLNVFHASLICAYIGVFLAGMSSAMIGAQCNFAASHHVDERSSALAASLINGLAPGLGGFLSPVIFTNLTNAIVKDSTNFRYQFVAFFALACGIALAIITRFGAGRGGKSLVETVCEESS